MSEAEDMISKKYGKPMPYDRNFRGPEWRNRSCTDVPCLLIFLVFLGGWGFVAHYAYKHGDLNKLMVPTDSFNRKCGMDSQVLDKPYLFFFDLDKCIDPLVPLTGCPTPQICVSACPTKTFIWEQDKNLPIDELKQLLICQTDADWLAIRSNRDAEKAIQENRCASKYLKSEPFFQRCMWDIAGKVCEYIPSSLLPSSTRNKRDYNLSSIAYLDPREPLHELTMQAMALTMSAPQSRVSPESSITVKNRALLDSSLEGVCRRKAAETEVIKEKMMKVDSRLAKYVGNLVGQFYNGTHDAQQLGEAIVEDIVNSWPIVLAAILGTLIVSLIFIALMRWVAGPILWFSIVGVLLGLIVAIYYSIREYQFWRDTATVSNHGLNINATVKNILQDANNWLYLTIFLCICFTVIFLSVIILRSRIRIAIALTKEGSKAVSNVKSTVFFPIFSWVLFVLAIVYAIAVGLYLGSIGEPAFRMIRQLDGKGGVTNENCVCQGPAINYTVGRQCDPTLFQQNCYNADSGGGFFRPNQRAVCTQTSCSFAKIDHPTMVQWFIAYNVFGFFWLTFFISAFNDMVLAAAFATWYWTFKKRNLPFFTLTKAFRQTIFYHLGTLAFGSLILAICRMIRLLLEYIDSKLKKYDNAVTRAILCMMRCFFWLLESFLRFLSRNAYIMCAIHGGNFCTSAKDAFNLVMRNFLRVVTIDKVTDFLFFLSKILLTAVAGAATYFFLDTHPALIKLNYHAVPTTIVVIAAFLITSVFFGVYSMAVDTLFLCFLEDCERNDGSAEKPYYMSKQLMKILGKHNELPPRRDVALLNK